MIKKKYTALLSAAVLLSSAVFGCSRTSADSSESKTGIYFDTVITITLYNEDASDENFDLCFSLASEYESKFSSEIASSEISQINASAGSPVSVSEETIELLETAYNFGDETDGLFDVTIGKLVDLWDISEIASSESSEDAVIPADSEISSLTENVDYRNLMIDAEENTVTLLNENAAIDVGGLAKGYIADQMKTALEDAGVTSGLINLGGNVLTIGTKPDSSEYTVGIQEPFDEDGNSIVSVSLSGQSAVTSGIYQRYFEKDGVIYHHILNPQTGYPEQNDLNSVTILCDSSTRADALSTSVFLMGLEDGLEYINSQDDVEAVFIDRDNNVYFSDGAEEIYEAELIA